MIKLVRTRITNGATALGETNNLIKDQITVVKNTPDSLNKKDTITTEEIKSINNTLTTTLKDIETKMSKFNIKFTDTEELQSEITKLKNEMINSVTSKCLANTNLIKTDLDTIKASKDELKERVRIIDNKNLEINIRISNTNHQIGTQNIKTTTDIDELRSGVVKIEELDKKIKTLDGNVKKVLGGLIKDLYNNNNKELKSKIDFIDINKNNY